MIFEHYQLASVTDLRNKASTLVKQAEEGRDTIIFKHNKPVGVLMGIEAFQELTQLTQEAPSD